MKLRYLLTTAAIAAMALPAVASAQISCNGNADSASTCSLTNTLTATAPNILRLTIGSTIGTDNDPDLAVSLGNPVEADYDAYGDSKNWKQTTAAVKVTARANRKYFVTADAGSWQFQADPTYKVCWSSTGAYGTDCLSSAFANITKPKNDLGLIIESSSSTTPDNTVTPTGMGSGAVSVIGSSGTPATPGSTAEDRYVWYRAGWNYATDVAGDYKIVVTYTITGS